MAYRTYEVQHPDNSGDEWMQFEATDHENAAEQYAQSFDSGGDYELLKGGSEKIAVRLKGDEAVQWFEIRGESVPTYYADAIDPPGVSDHPPPGCPCVTDPPCDDCPPVQNNVIGGGEAIYPAYGPGSITDASIYEKFDQ